MKLPLALKNNLLFLFSETHAELSNFSVLLETGLTGLADNILKRRGYAANLRLRIHESSAEALRLYDSRPVDTLSLRAAEAVSLALENIIDNCFVSVEYVGRVKSKKILQNKTLLKMPAMLLDVLVEIEDALERNQVPVLDDMHSLLKRLDRLREDFQSQRVAHVKKLKHPEDVISALYIANAMLQMGRDVVHITESMMSASIGQPMKLQGYLSLQSALTDFENREVQIKPIAETRSGSGISGIKDSKAADGDYLAIFKDGSKEKLREEKNSVKIWHQLFPGLAPQILAYNKSGKSASLLIEYLPGSTFEDILCNGTDELLQATRKRLFKTLRKIWQKTSVEGFVEAGHMLQLEKRLDRVLEIHPEFELGRENICGQQLPSLDDLVGTAKILEDKFPPVFSVLIHGDFNIDNIMYDEATDKIRFIDLHRSRQMDYVQDIAVFMVSNYRLQVFDRKIRQRITDLCELTAAFARDFAIKNQDMTFEFRLMLALARSFITSTRFILDRTLSRNMFYRGVYLLQQLSTMQEPVKMQPLSIRELFR